MKTSIKRESIFKKAILSISVFLTVVLASFSPITVQADEWGAKEATNTIENAEWSEFYYDVKGLKCSGYMPTYEGTKLVGDGSEALIVGSAEDYGYLITMFNTPFNPPKSGKEFRRLIEKSNPGVNAGWLNSKNIGAKYAVKFSHTENDIVTHWWVVCTKNRLIKISTDDTNEARREHFFQSFRIG